MVRMSWKTKEMDGKYFVLMMGGGGGGGGGGGRQIGWFKLVVEDVKT
jgi:hypothetical protein